jgi:L,D-peptidoglycan transpeptidase YkuD (ErfK/YbiS/YcfS/YnhG family)
MRRAGIVLVTVLALTAGGALVAPARAATPATPGRIDSLRGATRAIVVFNWSWTSTRAVVRTYQRARPGDRWRLVRGPMPARIGYNGFSANRREGDGTTPAGTFGFVYGFGSLPDPGMRGFPTAGCGRAPAGRAPGPTTTGGSPAPAPTARACGRTGGSPTGTPR